MVSERSRKTDIDKERNAGRERERETERSRLVKIRNTKKQNLLYGLKTIHTKDK